MNLTNFSLLYPTEQAKNDYYSGKGQADIDMYTLSELGMLEILDLKASELSDYFTTDPAGTVYVAGSIARPAPDSDLPTSAVSRWGRSETVTFSRIAFPPRRTLMS